MNSKADRMYGSLIISLILTNCVSQFYKWECLSQIATIAMKYDKP